jgi:hypothetical protein
MRAPEYQPVVNGEGVFLMPDDTPEMILDFLESCGHQRVVVPVASSTAALPPVVLAEVEIPVSEPEPEPVVPKADWPGCLKAIKGVGPSALKTIKEMFSAPKELLEYDDSNGPPGRIQPATWMKIKDYSKTME